MLFVSLLVSTALAFAIPASAHAADDARITGFNACLFDHGTGLFSEGILAEGGP